MATLRQTSFAAGELSPLLWGRSDLELFAQGARRLRNIVVTPQGAGATRPGTIRIETAKSVEVVLVPFVYSDTQSYVLEFGQYYVRVHDPEAGYLGIELVTPYLVEHLKELQFAQVGSILTVTHLQYEPREIRSPVLISGVPTAWTTNVVRFGPPGDFWTDASMQAYFVKSDGSPASAPHVTPEPRSRPLAELFVVDAVNTPREWRWKVSALVRNNLTGEIVETLPRTVTQYSDGLLPTTVGNLPDDGLVVLTKEKPIRLRHPSFGAVIPKPANWSVAGLIWYRGRGGLYGYIGDTAYAQDFIDIGDTPDFSRQPLRGESPFAGEFPAAVSFFQQRRVFAGTNSRPATMWASATDNWTNHDRPFVVAGALIADQPIEVSLVGRRREAIRSLVQHARLLAFTDSSVWSAEYQPGGAGESSLFTFRLEDEAGSTKLQPLVIDGTVLYVRAKGRGVRALELADSGAYVARDITWHAEHLFRDPLSQIVSWTYQRDPWGVIWAVRADGDLLSCTRTGANTWAWTQHHSEDGFVRSVASVPVARADVVLAAVTRNGVTYIERLCLRDRPTSIPIVADTGEDAFAVDCGTSFVVALGATRLCTGLDRFNGQDVWAVSPGNAPQGPKRVVGGEVTFGPFDVANRTTGDVLFTVGRAFTAELQTLDAMGLQQKNVTKVGFEVDNGQGLEAGQDFEHLVPWRQRDVQDGYEFPGAASELVVVAVKGAWRRHGRAVLRQAVPQPVTVLGISREVEAGGS